MKKIYSLLKLTIAAVAVGETIASYYKDEKFRSNLNSAKGFDKCKLIFNNLVEVNKSFFTDVKEIDVESKYNTAKDFVEGKLAFLNLKLDEIKENIDNLKEDKIEPVLNDMNLKISELKEKLSDNVQDISDKIKLEEKLSILEKKYEEIKKKFSK